jgi:carbon monoxide dehydrogenase subunit G
MQLNDALRIPLAPGVVWDALRDLALLRASLDHCESFSRGAGGEYALTVTVPLGPLRARYEIRAHVAGQPAPGGAERDLPHRMLSFKARADGLGSLRGQIEVTLRPDTGAGASGEPGTRIDYSIWAVLSGPLAELPSRQLENALHGVADHFFTEFCAVVQARHGLGPNRASGAQARRQHVFLRPAALSGFARRARSQDRGAGLTGRAAEPLSGARTHGVSHSGSGPHAMPGWAWAASILFVALLLYLARRLGLG